MEDALRVAYYTGKFLRLQFLGRVIQRFFPVFAHR